MILWVSKAMLHLLFINLFMVSTSLTALGPLLFRSGFVFIERTRSWYHHQIRRPQATVKKSFGLGLSGTVGDSNSQGTADNSNWPTSLIGRNISYEVPLKKKSAGINIRKLLRKLTVKLYGKKVTASVSDSQVGRNSIQLLDHVDVHFRRGRMTCLMGTSGAGKTT